MSRHLCKALSNRPQRLNRLYCRLFIVSYSFHKVIAWAPCHTVRPSVAAVPVANNSNSGLRVIYSVGNISKRPGGVDAIRLVCVPRQPCS